MFAVSSSGLMDRVGNTRVKQKCGFQELLPAQCYTSLQGSLAVPASPALPLVMCYQLLLLAQDKVLKSHRLVSSNPFPSQGIQPRH